MLVGTPPVPFFAHIGFSGPLSGSDFSGGVATYTAALGFDGVNAASTLTFSSLSSPTIAGLLTDTFNSLDSQLPPSLQQNLTLDLAHNSILFAYPTTAANPYVVGGTTDFGAG